MTKVECEMKIWEKIQEIMKLYHEYNPEGKTLSMYATEDFVSATNKYYSDDKEKPIDMYVSDETLVSREVREDGTYELQRYEA